MWPLTAWVDNIDPTTRFILFLFIGLVVYFLPTMAAYNRKHKNLAAIAATNVLLGWTCIGWCVAFIWAYTSNVEKPEPTLQQKP